MKFIHSADIHLDSALRGLERYDGAPVDELRGATRAALTAMVDLAVEEKVDLVLIAGDLYDADWRDYNTGLFFQKQMARLGEIPVVLISGNHDADSQITKELRLPGNVTKLPVKGPDTVLFEDIGVAVHGQSLASRSVPEDISASYPEPTRGLFNIGLLHTSAAGCDGHDTYAPCTLDGLRAKGYEYWALGHVHQRQLLGQNPTILFPGNLQGRHARETGEKGCTLVEVTSGEIEALQPVALDTVRWCQCEVDLTGMESWSKAYERIAHDLQSQMLLAGGRLLAVRVTLIGACQLHSALLREPDHYTGQVRGLAMELDSDRIWIEKVRIKTSAEIDLEAAARSNDAVGALLRSIRAVAADDGELVGLASGLDELQRKLPPELRLGEDKLDLGDVGFISEALADAEQLLLPRLLEKEVGR